MLDGCYKDAHCGQGTKAGAHTMHAPCTQTFMYVVSHVLFLR